MRPVLSMPHGLGAINAGEMLAFPGFASAKTKTAQRLPGTAEQLIENVIATIDELVRYAIDQRTLAEFQAAREKVFPKYFEAALGLSYLLPIVVPKHVLEVLAAESFSIMEAEFREHGLTAFGAEVRDQAIFTAWTLRKISDILQQIGKAAHAGELKENDGDIIKQFVFHAMCTRFSLDCLFKSMHLKKPLYPEVLPLVLDGLRSAVDGYALSRRLLDSRIPPSEVKIAEINWDDEDRQLLSEATRDEVAEPF